MAPVTTSHRTRNSYCAFPRYRATFYEHLLFIQQSLTGEGGTAPTGGATGLTVTKVLFILVV